MHVIIWEFTVREEHIQEFIRAYNSNGDWAQLFKRADGYLGTELLRSSAEPNIFLATDFLATDFLTIDRWESADCFDIFLKQFAAEYQTLDTKLEGYASQKRKWESSRPPGRDGACPVSRRTLVGVPARAPLCCFEQTRLTRSVNIPAIAVGVIRVERAFGVFCWSSVDQGTGSSASFMTPIQPSPVWPGCPFL